MTVFAKLCRISDVIVLALILAGIHFFYHQEVYSQKFRNFSSALSQRRNSHTFGDEEYELCDLWDKTTRPASESKNQCPNGGIVTVHQGGRLGNQMWEYASVYLIAKETGLEPFVPRCILDTLEEHFETMRLPSLTTIGDCPLNRNQIIRHHSGPKNQQRSIILPVYSMAWAEAPKWIDDLRREFVFKAELLESARFILQNLSERHNVGNPTFVGIHVRRTDYVRHLKKLLNAEPAPVSYYHNAMDYFEGKYNNVIFVLLTDSVHWCRKSLHRPESRLHIMSEPNERFPGRDMALLASCNHSIYDYGTYGDWGAILAGGETIVYNMSVHPTAMGAQGMLNWRVMN